MYMFIVSALLLIVQPLSAHMRESGIACYLIDIRSQFRRWDAVEDAKSKCLSLKISPAHPDFRRCCKHYDTGRMASPSTWSKVREVGDISQYVGCYISDIEYGSMWKQHSWTSNRFKSQFLNSEMSHYFLLQCWESATSECAHALIMINSCTNLVSTAPLCQRTIFGPNN